MRSGFKRHLIGLASAVSVLPIAVQAQDGAGDLSVQEQSAAGAVSHLEDIVVTARRREESLQSVPIAVSALTEKSLRDANITRLENVGALAPGLTIFPAVGGRANYPAFAIRGQRQDSPYLTNDPSVGVYVAEAAQTRVFGLSQSLFDLESIQVLKGPQGTLFGRNTTGGALLIQPKRPDLSDFEGYAQVRYGNFDRFDLQAAVNIPIADTLALRVSGNRTRFDGFGRNVRADVRLFGEHTDGVRGILLFEPNAGFSNTLYVDYFKSNQISGGGRMVYVSPGGPAQRLFNAGAILERQNAQLGFYESEGNVIPVSRGSNFGVTNVIVGEMSDELTLKQILNYRRLRTYELTDNDGTELPLLSIDESQNMQQLSSELQLQGKFLDGRLDVVAGLYYFFEDGVRYILTSALGGRPNPRTSDATNESASAFMQADYKITDQLTLTAGGRYTKDKRRLDQQLRSAATGVCIFCGIGEKTFKAPTYTFSLSYQIDPRKLIYVAHRLGYRSGGFNSSANAAAALAPFDKETVKDVEVGFKGDWALGAAALRTNIALYRSWYDDIQRTVVGTVDGVPVLSVFNAASAKIDGAEFEANFLPIPELEFQGSLAYTKPKYSEFLYVPAPGTIVDASGNRFAFVPRWTYRVGAKLTLPVDSNGTELFADLNWSWQSKIYLGEFNTENFKQDGYGLLGGRVALRNIADTGVELSLWGRNLLGKKYYVGGGDTIDSIGIAYTSMGEARTYGAEAIFRF